MCLTFFLLNKFNGLKKICFTLCAVTGLLVDLTFAADIEGGVAQRDLSSSAPAFMGKPASGESDLSPLSHVEGLSSSQAVSAAATGITYFEIGIVYSTLYGGYETISSFQSSTINNHGDSQLFIYVWQFGYGTPNNATMNGISKAPGLSEARSGSNLHVCSAGEIITGWLYGWDYSGQSAGYFTASANSTANPYGYWSDSLYIQ